MTTPKKQNTNTVFINAGVFRQFAAQHHTDIDARMWKHVAGTTDENVVYEIVRPREKMTTHCIRLINGVVDALKKGGMPAAIKHVVELKWCTDKQIVDAVRAVATPDELAAYLIYDGRDGASFVFVLGFILSGGVALLIAMIETETHGYYYGAKLVFAIALEVLFGIPTIFSLVMWVKYHLQLRALTPRAPRAPLLLANKAFAHVGTVRVYEAPDFPEFAKTTPLLQQEV